jgi:hypothetical protein
MAGVAIKRLYLSRKSFLQAMDFGCPALPFCRFDREKLGVNMDGGELELFAAHLELAFDGDLSNQLVNIQCRSLRCVGYVLQQSTVFRNRAAW